MKRNVLAVFGLVCGLGLLGCPPGEGSGAEGGYVQFMGGDGVFSPDFVKLSEGASEGSLVITPYVNDTNKPAIKAFSEAFEGAFETKPDAWAALTYDALGTVAYAIKEVGPDRQKVRDALAAMDAPENGYSGVTGVTYFDENGDCVKPAIISTVREGELVRADVQMQDGEETPPYEWEGEGDANGEPIVIGVAGPFTGQNQKFGEMIRYGATLKMNEINAKGGINGRPISIEWGDDEGNNSRATNVANDFASNPNLVAVVGHFNSTCSLAGKPVYQNAGIPAISPGSTNVTVCEGSDWMFRNLYRDDFQGQIAAQLIKKLGKTRVVVFFDNDDYGAGLKDYFVAAAEEAGLEVLPAISYNRESTTDFTPLVTNAKYEQPDVIFVAGLYNEAALIAKACRKAGLLPTAE